MSEPHEITGLPPQLSRIVAMRDMRRLRISCPHADKTGRRVLRATLPGLQLSAAARSGGEF
jgi:hypothetical protein